jgi:hypothetical protein
MTHEPLEKQKSLIKPIPATKDKGTEKPERPLGRQSPETTHLRAIGNMAAQCLPTENHSQLPSSFHVRAMGNQAAHMPNQDIPPIQRIKIRLEKRVNTENIGRLMLVSVPNEGLETLTLGMVPDNLDNDLDNDEIDADENIVFVGHGGMESVNSRDSTIDLGGFSPSEIAQIINKVKKPDNWSGSIYLLGCQTGDLVKSVSDSYKQKKVKVYGTRQKIKVGMDEFRSKFIGWRDTATLPQDTEKVKWLGFDTKFSKIIELLTDINPRRYTIIEVKNNTNKKKNAVKLNKNLTKLNDLGINNLLPLGLKDTFNGILSDFQTVMGFINPSLFQIARYETTSGKIRQDYIKGMEEKWKGINDHDWEALLLYILGQTLNRIELNDTDLVTA